MIESATLRSCGFGPPSQVRPFGAVGIPAFVFIRGPIDCEPRTHRQNLDVADCCCVTIWRRPTVAGVLLHDADVTSGCRAPPKKP